jgi:hypothetical protein
MKSSLAKRIQHHVMEKFDGDKRKALRYLQPKCLFYARKADQYRGKPLHEKWREIYQAYSQAEFAIEYWLECDEQFYRGEF